MWGRTALREDKTIEIWSLKLGEEVRTLAGHPTDFHLSLLGHHRSDDATLRICEIAYGKETKSVERSWHRWRRDCECIQKLSSQRLEEGEWRLDLDPDTQALSRFGLNPTHSILVTWRTLLSVSRWISK